MVFLRFTNTVCDIPLGLILFHHVKLMNHAIIISHCTILVGVKTECNIIFFFQGLDFFLHCKSHFKILNITFAYATNKGLYKKNPLTYPSIETSSLILYQLQVQQYAEMLLISKF